jgi:hypothetical protein
LRKLTALVLCLASMATTAGTAQARSQHSLQSIVDWQKKQIKLHEQIAKDKMMWLTIAPRVQLLKDITIEQADAHLQYADKLRVKLAANLEKLRKEAQAPSWLVNAFLCIHRYEGSWTDAGDPYWGGLQMDMQFMATYGGDLLRTKGTADRWTPMEQIGVAIKAYNSGRGFYPWPNTAHYCGLI